MSVTDKSAIVDCVVLYTYTHTAYKLMHFHNLL